MKRVEAMRSRSARNSLPLFCLPVLFLFFTRALGNPSFPTRMGLAEAFGLPFADSPPPALQAAAPPAGASKVASGEYRIFSPENSGGVGPFAAEVYDFREYWTLWRLPDGRFWAEGEREFDSPRDLHHSNAFQVQLSRDFQVTALEEYAKLKWQPDSGPLRCEFHPAELVCTSGAKNPSHEAGLHIAMKHPYGFLWPISAFSISNITRAMDPVEGFPNPVQLVTIEEPSRSNPVLPTILDGRLRYLGREEISLAGQKWDAQKFALKVPFHPPLLIWTSSKGLLLAFAADNATKTIPKEGLKLVEYRQWARY